MRFSCCNIPSFYLVCIRCHGVSANPPTSAIQTMVTERASNLTAKVG
jgi:hypothetical protein